MTELFQLDFLVATGHREEDGLFISEARSRY